MERYFPMEEYEQRWDRVYGEMDRRGFDAAVVWSRSAGTYERCADVLYLSNYYSTHSGHELDSALWQARSFSALILQNGDTPELHMDEPEPRFNLLSTDRAHWHWDVIGGVAEAVNRRKLEGRVAFVGEDFFPIKYFHKLQELTPRVTWVAQDDLVRVVRKIKSERELNCYREGGEIASRAISLLIGGLIDRQTEAQAAATAAAEVIAAGGQFHMIPVNHGDTINFFCRSPLTGASQDAPVEGDLVRGWVYGPIFQGYWLDPGRTAVAGNKPNRDQRDLIETTAGIVDACIAAVLPGVKCMDVARLGEQMTVEAGSERDQAGEQWPLWGHGVGLYWEPPILGPKLLPNENEVFDAGMVLGVEAFLSYPGIGAAGFEQNVIVTATGTELLTTAPMIWH